MITSFLEQYQKYASSPRYSFWTGYTASIDSNQYWRFNFGSAQKRYKLGLLRGQPIICRISDNKVIARTLRCEDLSIIYGFLAILNGKHFPELCQIKTWKRHFDSSSERLAAIRAIVENKKNGIFIDDKELKCDFHKTDDEFRESMKRLSLTRPDYAKQLTYQRIKNKHKAERFKYSYEEHMRYKSKRRY
jgi:hypothetical protein